ncbi:MAG: hypothetical protein EB165_04065 [Euryarchaeota archaeon]|nr:hypothetical protein [Euryarchaeota archaeon]
MKTYEQWSARGKQLGWAPDQYSEAAYQGYVNNMKAQSVGGGNPGGQSKPLSYAPPPLQSNTSDLENQIKQLADAMEAQTNAHAAEIANIKAKTPKDVSKALNSTILTGTAGTPAEEEKKRKMALTGGAN